MPYDSNHTAERLALTLGAILAEAALSEPFVISQQGLLTLLKVHGVDAAFIRTYHARFIATASSPGRAGREWGNRRVAPNKLRLPTR